MLSHPDGASSIRCQRKTCCFDTVVHRYIRYLFLYSANKATCECRVDQHEACCTKLVLSLTDLCKSLQDFEHDIQSPNSITTAATGKSVPATGA